MEPVFFVLAGVIISNYLRGHYYHLVVVNTTVLRGCSPRCLLAVRVLHSRIHYLPSCVRGRSIYLMLVFCFAVTVHRRSIHTFIGLLRVWVVLVAFDPSEIFAIRPCSDIFL